MQSRRPGPSDTGTRELAGGLTHSASLQAQIQGSGLAHHNIYHHICEVLEHTKGPVLEIKSRKISMTWVNIKISERSSDEDPVMPV